jgi:hypothetical protein
MNVYRFELFWDHSFDEIETGKKALQAWFCKWL